ncbi:MAG: methyltransferase domain-containing protein [Arachnia sp.]
MTAGGAADIPGGRDATTEHVRAAYDTVADAYDRLVADVSVEAPIDLAMVQLLLDRVGRNMHASVLDAGCGPGRMMTHLRLLDPTLELTGMDLTPAMVQRARHHHPSLRIEQGDLTQMPFPAGTFDGVLSWYSIIHTPERTLHGVFSEFRRVLRPDGALLLGFHAGTGERIARRAYGHDVDLSIQLHDVRRVRDLLEGAGFLVRASLERGARAVEKGPQGFLLTTRG